MSVFAGCRINPGMANDERERHPGILVALDAAGGVTRLARALHLLPSTIAKWQRVPQAHVQTIAQLYGIMPYELRPDLEINRTRSGDARLDRAEGRLDQLESRVAALELQLAPKRRGRPRRQ